MNQKKRTHIINEIHKLTDEEFKERMRNDDEFLDSVMELLEESPEAMRHVIRMISKIILVLPPQPPEGRLLKEGQCLPRNDAV